MFYNNTLARHFPIYQFLIVGEWAIGVPFRREEKLPNIVILPNARVPRIDSDYKFFEPALAGWEVLPKHPVVMAFPYEAIAQKKNFLIGFRVLDPCNYSCLYIMSFFYPNSSPSACPHPMGAGLAVPPRR